MLISAAALGGLRRGLRIAALVLGGAVAGGLATYAFARADPEAARAILLAIPAISEPLLARVAALLQGGLVGGMIAGAFSGAPCKIFAAEAAATGVGPLAFALASLPARGLRFALVAILAAALARWPFGGMAPRVRFAVLAGVWALFYAGYFAVMGW